MEERFIENMNVLNTALSKAFDDINKLYDLPYFDKENFEKNKKDLQLILVNEDDGKFFGDDQAAMYLINNNSLCVKKSILNNYKVYEDALHALLLHELIHMSSTNVEKKRTGFDHDAFPITYNEGCTQYLTMKLLYGDDIDKALEGNIFYPESTRFVKKIVDDLGEEKVFHGYFEADARKCVDAFTPKELDIWTDTVMKMSKSNEERITRDNMNQMKENVDELNVKHR